MLADHRPGGGRLGGSDEVQANAAQGGKVGQGVGIAGSGSILAHEGVAFPVVADFDSAPVAADQFEPLGRGALIGRIAADVRACFEGAGCGLLGEALGSNDDHGAREGEVDGIGFDREGLDLPALDATVSGFTRISRR